MDLRKGIRSKEFGGRKESAFGTRRSAHGKGKRGEAGWIGSVVTRKYFTIVPGRSGSTTIIDVIPTELIAAGLQRAVRPLAHSRSPQPSRGGWVGVITIAF